MKILSGLCLILLGVPAISTAQSPPRVEVRTAIGASNYLHGDIDYIAPTLLVSVRFGGSTMAIEPEYTRAWHEGRQEFGAPTTTVTTRTTYQSVGVNIIRRWPGRVSGYAGGGVGAFSGHHSTHTVSAMFGTFSDERDQPVSAGVQFKGGVDVRMTSYVTAFGEGRYEIRSLADPGGGSVVQGFAGVAVSLWR